MNILMNISFSSSSRTEILSWLPVDMSVAVVLFTRLRCWLYAQPQSGESLGCSSSDLYPSICPTWVTLPGVDSGLRSSGVTETPKLSYRDKVAAQHRESRPNANKESLIQMPNILYAKQSNANELITPPMRPALISKRSSVSLWLPYIVVLFVCWTVVFVFVLSKFYLYTSLKQSSPVFGLFSMLLYSEMLKSFWASWSKSRIWKIMPQSK